MSRPSSVSSRENGELVTAHSAATSEAIRTQSVSPRRGGGAARLLFHDRAEIVLTPLVLVVVILAWHLITAVELVSPVILPSPADVFSAVRALVSADYFWPNLQTTVIEVLGGFAIAAVTATACAIVMNEIALVRRVLYPYAVLFQVVPSIVLAPIFVIWFGFGISSKIVVAAVTAFFVILVNTLAGLASVPENSRLLLDSLCASRRQVLFKLTLPTALPYVFAAFKTASTLALIGALVGEFITARQGLGKLLTTFSFGLKQDMVFATVIIVGLLGICLYGLVALLEKKVIWWR
jgi:NitT/TauT family transport system permease protein